MRGLSFPGGYAGWYSLTNNDIIRYVNHGAGVFIRGQEVPFFPQGRAQLTPILGVPPSFAHTT